MKSHSFFPLEQEQDEIFGLLTCCSGNKMELGSQYLAMVQNSVWVEGGKEPISGVLECSNCNLKLFYSDQMN